MDKGRYDYDPELKQYRRKYPKEVISKPDPESVERDIYATGHSGEEPLQQTGRLSYTPPGKKWKVLFWMFFVLVLGIWIYLIYLAMNPEEDEVTPSLDLKPGVSVPSIP